MGNAVEPKHHGPDPQWYKDPSLRGQQLLYPNADTTPSPALHAGHGRRTTGVCASTPFCAFWGSLWPRTVICRWSFADRKRVRRTFVI